MTRPARSFSQWRGHKVWSTIEYTVYAKAFHSHIDICGTVLFQTRGHDFGPYQKSNDLFPIAKHSHNSSIPTSLLNMRILYIFGFVLADASISRRQLQPFSCLPSLGEFEITADCRTFHQALEARFKELDPPCDHSLSKEKKILSGQRTATDAGEYLIDYCEIRLEEDKRNKAQGYLRSKLPAFH